MKSRKKIHWISITEILSTWGSCDSEIAGENYPENKMLTESEWQVLLDYKRKEQEYKKLYEIIQKEGFNQPLVFCSNWGRTLHLDGHHRLAVAIDLGYKYIPYIKRSKVKDIWVKCYEDFSHFNFTHPENPQPVN